MRSVILYIAMSLDGYIADAKGGVDWLSGDGSMVDAEGSYSKFIEGVDSIVLGYSTYHQIKTELSPDKWVYEGKMSYVMTHREEQSSDEIIFSDESLDSLIRRLKVGVGGDIWICGGASIVNQLIDLNLIDRFHITMIPTVLGGGIPLFQGRDRSVDLKLISTQTYNGMVDLVYERR